MSLIKGNENVMTQNKKQEKQIAKLKEDYERMKDWTDRHQEEIHRLKDDKKKLKEENEKLKKQIDEQKDIIIELEEYQDKYEDLEEEVCNLNTEMKLYKSKLIKIKSQYDELELSDNWTMNDEFVITTAKDKCLQDYHDWCDAWYVENIDEEEKPNLSQLQYAMEGDMADYYNNNRDDFTKTAKDFWMELFDEDDEDADVSHLEDVGVIYWNIEQYCIHSLGFDKENIIYDDDDDE